MIKSALECIVKSLVDKPEAVLINEAVEEGKLRLTIKVDAADMGKVIGKEGKTIKSLRVFAASLGSKDNHISIDLVK